MNEASSDYIPIQSLDIEGERAITFDLFLNLPLNNKVILYRKKGGAVENQRLARLVGDNLQTFWIRKGDYQEFVKYVAQRLRSLVEHPNPFMARKMMVSSAKAILGSTFHAQDSAMAQALMGNLNEITSVLIESVLENVSPVRKKAFKRLIEMAESGSDFHKHPVNVTSLAVLITYGIGYSTDKILSEVAMGALLHDIGLAKVPAKIAAAAHDVLLLPVDERAQLYKHGDHGLEILQERGVQISEIMKAIISQHHEQFNGNGYPLGLRGFVVNEFAQIVRVADDLDQLLRSEVRDAESLRKDLIQLFAKLHDEKILEPGLAARIRKLFVEF